jgi:serine/threonine-protein kinase HipA
MTRCLYCNKPISRDEHDFQWHPACVKKFFGTTSLPTLALDESRLLHSAATSIEQGHAVPGVQKKLALHLLKTRGKGQLTVIGRPLGYIVKLPVKEYPLLPEYEHLTMQLASLARIPTVEHALYRLEDGTLAYLTKRIDRVGETKIAMEDFCQLGGRLTEDKYRSSCEQLGKILRRHSRRLLDAVALWHLLLFCFVTGNSDMHLKNFSLYAPDGDEYILTPAYDLLPTNLILPEDSEESALTLRGKRNRLKKEDFVYLAQQYGIHPKTVEGLIARIVGLQESFFEAIEQSFLPEEAQKAYKALIAERIGRLS